MTLEQFIKRTETAIRCNFRLRNSIVADPKRMTLIKRQRRDTIRCFIKQHRAASNQATSAIIADKITHLVN